VAHKLEFVAKWLLTFDCSSIQVYLINFKGFRFTGNWL